MDDATALPLTWRSIFYVRLFLRNNDTCVSPLDYIVMV
nr:MAG TPA: hypothetical protein [Caudoviricetes sp.]